MGMESFFISAIPRVVEVIEKKVQDKSDLYVRSPEYKGESKLALQDILILFVEKKIKYKQLNENEVLIDGSIILSTIEKNSNIVELSFEACFSWYPDSLDYCVYLVSVLNTYRKMNLYFWFQEKGERFNLEESNIFQEKIRNFYCKKYKQFIERYNCFDIKLPPGNKFYHKINSPWYRIYRYCKGGA